MLRYLIACSTVPQKQWITQLGRFPWSLYFCNNRTISSCASRSWRNKGFCKRQANLICSSKTSNCMSGGEKFLLKSRPHSPIATHSELLASSVMDERVSVAPSSSHDFASCGWIPEKQFDLIIPNYFFVAKLEIKFIHYVSSKKRFLSVTCRRI